MAYYTVSIPDPMALRHKERAPVVRVLARDGSLLSERGGDGAYVPLDLLPRHLIHAVIATEDRRFFKHWGLDPTGMMRAAFTNLRAGRVAQGGSTLTQQLAKNLFLGSERTYARKLEELVLALWLEARLGKRNILELYLNRVYFGAGAYGVETASQRFFGKSAREVTLVEAAVLAGLLKAPSRYSPASNPQVARARAADVLAKMVEARLLSAEESDKAGQATLRFAERLRPRTVGPRLCRRRRAGAACRRWRPRRRATSSSRRPSTPTCSAARRPWCKRAVAARDNRQGKPGRARARRPGGRHPGGGRRALVRGEPVQSRAEGEAAAGLGLQAVRLPRRARERPEPDSTVLDLPILGAGWSPRNEGGGIPRRRDLARCARPIDERRRRAPAS